MAQSSLKVMRGVLSATSEYIPDGAAKQAKLFITEQVSAVVGAIANCARSNLSTTASALLAATGLSVRAAPAIVSAPALVMSGFGSTGVGAGTLAAAAQSSVGNVATGSVFATLQSAGAGGAGVATVHGMIQIGAGLVTTLSSEITFFKIQDSNILGKLDGKYSMTD